MERQEMNSIQHTIIAAVLVVFLLACGSGSSSSGGGRALVGTYSGYLDVLLYATGNHIGSVSGRYLVKIRINDDRTVESNVGNGWVKSGRLSGKKLKFTHPAWILNSKEFKCTGVLHFTATRISGKFFGNLEAEDLSCNGITFRLYGSWSVI
jgi:hypothetical protein